MDNHTIFLLLSVVFLTVGVMCAVWNHSTQRLKFSYDNIKKRILSLEDASKLNKISGKKTDDDLYDIKNDDYPVLKKNNTGLSDRFDAIIRRSRIAMGGAIGMAIAMGTGAALTWPDQLPAVDPQPRSVIVMDGAEKHDGDVKEVPPATEEIAEKVETEKDNKEEKPVPPDPAVDLVSLRNTISLYMDREVIQESSVPVEKSFVYLRGIQPCEEKSLYCDRLVHGDLIITIHDYEEAIKSLFIMMYNRFEKGWGETLDRYFLEQFNNQNQFNALCQSSPQCLAIDGQSTDEDRNGLNEDDRRKLKMMWYLHLVDKSIKQIHKDIQTEHDGTDTIILNWHDYIHQARQYYHGPFTLFLENISSR